MQIGQKCKNIRKQKRWIIQIKSSLVCQNLFLLFETSRKLTFKYNVYENQLY